MQTISPFEQDIAKRIPVIQDLLSSILEDYCGVGDAGISTICSRLGIHRKLAWQVRNVAYSSDPFRAVRFMPSKAGVEALAKAILHHGATEGKADRLRDLGVEFDELVAIHAGDRVSMEMLVESCMDRPEEDAEVKWREQAFQGNRFIWGVQAKTQLTVNVLNFSKGRSDWFDYLQVRGLIGLRRLRRNVHWLVSQSMIVDEDVKRDGLPNREPLDAEAAKLMNGVPVLPEFCSEPMPKLRRRPVGQGLTNDELLPAPVGCSGQQTIVTGEIIRELSPVYATSENKRALFGAVVRTPCEVFVHDHFVHRDLFPDAERELVVFSELNSSVTQDDDDMLPISESVECLGRGLSVARTAAVPGYMKLLRGVFARAGWDPDDFDLYRVRMAYPPMPTSVVIRHYFPRNKDKD